MFPGLGTQHQEGKEGLTSKCCLLWLENQQLTEEARKVLDVCVLLLQM